MDLWKIEKNGFEKSDIELHGSKYLIGNGYMGYRGTMEEYSANELVAVNLAGLFDKNGDLWRESVNAPNPLYTALAVNGKVLSVADTPVSAHTQTLDIRHGIHKRKTVFSVCGAEITVTAERFVSMARESIAALRYSVSSDKDITLTLSTGIDNNIWDINGPHIENREMSVNENYSRFTGTTVQNAIEIEVHEYNSGISFNGFDTVGLHTAEIRLTGGKSFTFEKTAGIYWGDGVDASYDEFCNAKDAGFDTLLAEHKAKWDEVWDRSDVVIEGDDEAQLALRYSIYHLNTIAPQNTDKCGIPARGLSGQVYKGASFWDTEMFMLPFFGFTNPEIAKNLVKYRINTLGGAKRKAKEFGFEGAFYAWESQETGDDACTLFNVTDIFTNRPLRTYFKDKQIHVSADIVFATWDYCTVSGDYTLLRDGGLNMFYECVRFFYTYASFKKYKNRYELLDVVGPDEYHERVNNNAFTNIIVKHAANILVAALEKTKVLYPEIYGNFKAKTELDWVYDFAEKLYAPEPDENGIIEQFDGYFKLEDTVPAELKKRELKENEYWGCHGLASTTRVLKQADVVMMLNVFRSEYSEKVKRANWEFYEPYTEHGSSLSACAYAIVAANIGYTDWAYKYFMKTATVDLNGSTRQYLGSLYIGGTHPAANGGSWNTAIYGFGGVSFKDDVLDISPGLPEKWKSLSFKLQWQGVELRVAVNKNGVEISADKKSDLKITVNGKKYEI